MMRLNFRWNSPLFQSEWTLFVFSEWEVPSVTDWYCVCSWPLDGGVPCIPQLPFRMENFPSYCSVIRAPKLWFSSSILIQNFVSYTITSFQTFLANWFEVLLGDWLNFVQKGSLLSNQCKCCRIWFVCKLWENNTWYTYDIVKSTRVLFWLLWRRRDWLQNSLVRWIDLALKRLICLNGSRNYSIGHLLQRWLLAWQPQSGSCLSPVPVLVDCWPFSTLTTVKCHFSVITFGNCGSVPSQLQIHYVNLKKSTYFQIVILT